MELPPIKDTSLRVPKINFQATETKYYPQAAEFQQIWQTTGSRITQAFMDVSGLPFTEECIQAKVGYTQHNYSHAGRSTADPMVFSFRSRDKQGTLVHELVHRYIREYGLLDLARSKYALKHEHQLLDLFYFDIMKLVYGEEKALERIEHEKKDRNPTYQESWDWFMQLPQEERIKMRSEIISLVMQRQ